MQNSKHGLICARLQPFHNGHLYLINKALKECGYVTVAIGSAQEKETERNPFSFEQRKEMLTNIFGSHEAIGSLYIKGIADINNPPKWAEHVLSIANIWDNSQIIPEICEYSSLFPRVTDYYAGTEKDASLFRSIPDITVHVEDRTKNKFKSATEIRKMIKENDLSWMNYIPNQNWDFIESCLVKKSCSFCEGYGYLLPDLARMNGCLDGVCETCGGRGLVSEIRGRQEHTVMLDDDSDKSYA